MSHYEIGRWADFARNVTAPRERAKMEEHLASQCAECGATLEFLRKVTATAALEPNYESVTPDLSAAARRVFTLPALATRWPDKVLKALQVLVGRLTFDSAADLQPAGARAHRTDTRQVMYEAGDFCLDLRFDRERDSMHIMLVGQVANQKNPEFRVARLPVFILSGQKVVSQTASNEFGEFSLEYIPRSNLRLCVPVPEAGVRLEVSLKRLLEEHAS